MMAMDPMREALKRRKSKGVDITISIDPAESTEKDTDLAPKGEAHEEQEMMMDPEQAMGEGEAPSDMQMIEELVSDMSENDKQMAMAPGAKPGSLGQRARMDALEKLKQHGK